MNFWVCMDSEIYFPMKAVKVSVFNLFPVWQNSRLIFQWDDEQNTQMILCANCSNIFHTGHIFYHFGWVTALCCEWMNCFTDSDGSILCFCCRNCLPGRCLQCQEKVCSCWRQRSQSGIYNCTWTWAQVRTCPVCFFTDATVVYFHLKSYKWNY